MDEGQSKKIRQRQPGAARFPLTHHPHQPDADSEPDRKKNQHGCNFLIRSGVNENKEQRIEINFGSDAASQSYLLSGWDLSLDSPKKGSRRPKLRKSFRAGRSAVRYDLAGI